MLRSNLFLTTFLFAMQAFAADPGEPTLNSMLKSHMHYMTQRQTVLANNISNIDTPGYKARELAPLDFKRMADSENNRLAMAATSPSHLSGTLPQGGGFRSEKDRNTFETRPTLNDVVLTDQMAKVSDTTAQFNLSSTLMKKYTGLYRTAAGNK